MTINNQDHLIQTYLNCPEKIALLDTQLNLIWANNSLNNLLQILQLNFEESNSLPIRKFLKDYLHNDELIINDIINGLKDIPAQPNGVFTYEFPLYSFKDALWLMLTANYTTQDDDKLIVLKINDITTLYKKRKLEQKIDNNELVKLIITESMHTWRQPLNSISLFVQDIKEQFSDGDLTKYYANFATRQIFNEIKRLSDSIDEMAVFYSNDSDEDNINVAEAMFRNIEDLDAALKNSNTEVTLNCHALGDILTETYIPITENFKIRCGTGTKKCFHGCNKGNLVINGDKTLYHFIVRLLISLGMHKGTDTNNLIRFEHSIEKNQLHVRINYSSYPEHYEDDLRIIGNMLTNNFDAIIQHSQKDSGLELDIIFNKYKSKSPI